MKPVYLIADKIKFLLRVPSTYNFINVYVTWRVFALFLFFLQKNKNLYIKNESSVNSNPLY